MNTDDPAYQKTLDYLYSFVDFSLQKTFHTQPPAFGLEKIRRFVELLGHPQARYPVIHVAGTKGKGSVSALCAGALQAAGYRVGLYTSPHLEEYTERIQIDGQPIPPERLVALVEANKAHIEAIPQLSMFEITTGLALLYFAEQQVDAAVIEVGLGGRLDATNVVSPLVSVITSLSFDHTYLLGNTLNEIAAEKAGIIKPGRPVVVAPQKEDARQVVAAIAAERGAPHIQIGTDYRYTPGSRSLAGQELHVWHESDPGRQIQLQISLLGEHQLENAVTAYAALQTAAAAGLALSTQAIQDGFAQTRWPGRFEVLNAHPPVVVDSAHNRDSALRLRQALDDYFPGLPVVLVFGASEDKDIAGMLTELLPRVETVIATRSIHPRAIEPSQLAEMVAGLGRPTFTAETIEAALEIALQKTTVAPTEHPTERLVLVTGSIFIAAGGRQAWLKRPGPIHYPGPVHHQN